nr:MnhB domain-containing protein [Pseudarthrobacter equi]
MIFSLYLLFAGHNLPGGGFAGGLTAGLALTIRYLAGGRFELSEATPVSAGGLLGIGLATAAAPVLPRCSWAARCSRAPSSSSGCPSSGTSSSSRRPFSTSACTSWWWPGAGRAAQPRR